MRNQTWVGEKHSCSLQQLAVTDYQNAVEKQLPEIRNISQKSSRLRLHYSHLYLLFFFFLPFFPSRVPCTEIEIYANRKRPSFISYNLGNSFLSFKLRVSFIGIYKNFSYNTPFIVCLSYILVSHVALCG